MNAHEQPAPMLPDEWLDEYDAYVEDAVALARGELSPEREAGVRARLETDATYRSVVLSIVDAYAAPPTSDEEFEPHWQDVRRRAGLATVQAGVHLYDAGPARRKRRARRGWRALAGRMPRLARIAAVAMIAAGALTGFTASYLWFFSWAEYVTAAAETITHELPDRSVVQLGASSSLRYRRHFRDERGRLRRELWVSGEATVHVAAHRRPIEVRAGGISVSTTEGTFTIVVRDSDGQVLVLDGQATVRALHPRDGASAAAVVIEAGGAARVIGGRVHVQGRNGAR